jgi:hypothetical protein
MLLTNQLPAFVAAVPSCATDKAFVPVPDTSVAHHPTRNVQLQPHTTSAPQIPLIPVSITHNQSSNFSSVCTSLTQEQGILQLETEQDMVDYTECMLIP